MPEAGAFAVLAVAGRSARAGAGVCSRAWPEVDGAAGGTAEGDGAEGSTGVVTTIAACGGATAVMRR